MKYNASKYESRWVIATSEGVVIEAIGIRRELLGCSMCEEVLHMQKVGKKMLPQAIVGAVKRE